MCWVLKKIFPSHAKYLFELLPVGGANKKWKERLKKIHHVMKALFISRNNGAGDHHKPQGDTILQTREANSRRSKREGKIDGK